MNLSREWDILRVSTGVSWVSIAKKMNCNRKTLYGMVNSKNPTINTLTALGEAFDVNYISVLRSAAERDCPTSEDRVNRVKKLISELPDNNGNCVYPLIDDLGRVFYVGKSTKLKQRLANHIRKADFFGFFFRQTENNLDDEEMLDIIKFNPSLNKGLKSTQSTPSISTLKMTLKDIIERMDYNPSVFKHDPLADRYSRRDKGLVTKDKYDRIVKSVMEAITNEANKD